MRFEDALALAQQQLNGGLSHPQPVRQEPVFEQPRLSPETTLQLELEAKYLQQIQEQHLLHRAAMHKLDARFAHMASLLPPDLQAQVLGFAKESEDAYRSGFNGSFGQ